MPRHPFCLLWGIGIGFKKKRRKLHFLHIFLLFLSGYILFMLTECKKYDMVKLGK